MVAGSFAANLSAKLNWNCMCVCVCSMRGTITFFGLYRLNGGNNPLQTRDCWRCADTLLLAVCDEIDEIRARETLQSKFCRSAVTSSYHYFCCYMCVLCCAVYMWRLMQDGNYINFQERMRMYEWKRERDWEGIFWAQVQGILTHKRHIHLTYKPQFQFQFKSLSHFQHCFCKIFLWDCNGQILAVAHFGFNHNENKNK